MAYSNPEDQKKFHKQWYEKNKELRIQQNKELKNKKLEFIQEYKKEFCCKQCGEKDPFLLKFYQGDGKGFCNYLSQYSIERIKEEIAKSEVYCDNCKKKPEKIKREFNRSEMIGVDAPHPFSGYKVYGPIFHKGENRKYICLVGSLDRTTISYARYLMSIHLGRLLEKHEHVDHINENKLDDRIENLQILTPEENTRKSAKPAILIECVCENCQEIFYRRKGQEPGTNRKKSFCSPECSIETMILEERLFKKLKENNND